MLSAQPSCHVGCVSRILEHLNLREKNVEAAFMGAKVDVSQSGVWWTELLLQPSKRALLSL